MRLFVAIEPPIEVLKSLQNLQIEARREFPEYEEADEIKATDTHFRTPHSPWRYPDIDKMHLTLQFLGDGITHHRSDDIIEALKKIEYEQFEIECTGVGAFPKANSAKVLWVGVKSDKLSLLASEVNKNVSSLGLIPDREFSPHITIARCKFPSDISKFVEENANKVWHEERWSVESFSLVESVYVLGGYEYQTLQKYSLI